MWQGGVTSELMHEVIATPSDDVRSWIVITTNYCLLLRTKHTSGTNMYYVLCSPLLDLCRSDVGVSLQSSLPGTHCGMCNCAAILDNTHDCYLRLRSMVHLQENSQGEVS